MLDPRMLQMLMGGQQGGQQSGQSLSGQGGGQLANAPPMGLLSGLNFPTEGFSGATGAGTMAGGGQGGGMQPGMEPGPGLDALSQLLGQQGTGDQGGANTAPLLAPIGGGSFGAGGLLNSSLGQQGGGQLGTGGGLGGFQAGQFGQPGMTAGQTAGSSADPLAILQKLLGLVKPLSQVAGDLTRGSSGTTGGTASIGGGNVGTASPVGAGDQGNLAALTTGQETPPSQSLAQSGLFSFLNNPTLQDPTFVLNTLGLLQGGESPESFLHGLSPAQSQGLQQALFSGQEQPFSIGGTQTGLTLGTSTNLQDPALGQLGVGGGGLDLFGPLEQGAGVGSSLLNLVNFVRSQGGGEPNRPDAGGFGVMSPAQLKAFYAPEAVAGREAAFQRQQQSAPEGQFGGDAGTQGPAGIPGMAFSEASGPGAVGMQGLNQSDITGLGQAAMNLNPTGALMAGLGLAGLTPSNFIEGMPGRLGNEALGMGIGKGLGAIGAGGLNNPISFVQSALMSLLGLQGNQAINQNLTNERGTLGLGQEPSMFGQPSNIPASWTTLMGQQPNFASLTPTMDAQSMIANLGGINTLGGYGQSQAMAFVNMFQNMSPAAQATVQASLGNAGITNPTAQQLGLAIAAASRGGDPTISGYSGLGLTTPFSAHRGGGADPDTDAAQAEAAAQSEGVVSAAEAASAGGDTGGGSVGDGSGVGAY